MLFFFGYWTSMGMEIFQKNVAFFWLLDFYGYGNFQKKCCFFLAIGLLWVWKFPKKMLFFFGYWTSMGLDFYGYGLGKPNFRPEAIFQGFHAHNF